MASRFQQFTTPGRYGSNLYINPERVFPTVDNLASRLAGSPLNSFPSWSFPSDKPRLGEIRAGVKYINFETKVLKGLIRDAEIKGVWAGIGPNLFLGRDYKGWVEYDPNTYDQNERCSVKNRPGVWRIGDSIWAAVLWAGQKVYLEIEGDLACTLWMTPDHAVDFDIRQAVHDIAAGRTSFTAREVPSVLLRAVIEEL